MTLVKEGEIGGRAFAVRGGGEDRELVCLDCLETMVMDPDAFAAHACAAAGGQGSESQAPEPSRTVRGRRASATTPPHEEGES